MIFGKYPYFKKPCGLYTERSEVYYTQFPTRSSLHAVPYTQFITRSSLHAVPYSEHTPS